MCFRNFPSGGSLTCGDPRDASGPSGAGHMCRMALHAAAPVCHRGPPGQDPVCDFSPLGLLLGSLLVLAERSSTGVDLPLGDRPSCSLSLRREVEGLAKGSQGSGWDMSSDPTLKGLGKLSAPCVLSQTQTNSGLGSALCSFWDPAGLWGSALCAGGLSSTSRHPRECSFREPITLLEAQGRNLGKRACVTQASSRTPRSPPCTEAGLPRCLCWAAP